MGGVKLFSPAKVNLFLNVLRKRKDGYHELETLFERIDLKDTITIRRTPRRIRIQNRGEKVPSDTKHLAYRAAKLLKDTYHVRQGVRITVQKRIPVSAGLGGGSSNAATVLLGLNRLWKLGLSRQVLLKLGAKLGSDVPFFILETPFALAKGRGELLKKFPAPGIKLWHVLVKPPFSISTKTAYRVFDALTPPLRPAKRLFGGAGLTLPKAGVRMLLHSIQKGDSGALAKLLTNSLELTLNKRLTEILKIKKRLLKEGAAGALLSGSGSCVFGLFSSKAKAVKAARRLRQAHRAWKVFVASTYFGEKLPR